MKQAAFRETFTVVDVISAARSGGGAETDAEVIYSAKLHLDGSAVCDAVN